MKKVYFAIPIIAAFDQLKTHGMAAFSVIHEITLNISQKILERAL